VGSVHDVFFAGKNAPPQVGAESEVLILVDVLSGPLVLLDGLSALQFRDKTPNDGRPIIVRLLSRELGAFVVHEP
jgi:hypothetical protein